jgi:hypothetical protein
MPRNYIAVLIFSLKHLTRMQPVEEAAALEALLADVRSGRSPTSSLRNPKVHAACLHTASKFGPGE